MVIAAAVAVPAVSNLNERWRLEGAAWRLASDMRMARHLAITQGKYMRFEFRWLPRDYYMFLPVKKTTVMLPEGIEYAYINFPCDGVNVYKFSISSLGAPTQGGTVGLKNRRGDRLYIIITPVTGRVRVSPDPPP